LGARVPPLPLQFPKKTLYWEKRTEEAAAQALRTIILRLVFLFFPCHPALSGIAELFTILFRSPGCRMSGPGSGHLSATGLRLHHPESELLLTSRSDGGWRNITMLFRLCIQRHHRFRVHQHLSLMKQAQVEEYLLAD
jgi:hypothetical protein